MKSKSKRLLIIFLVCCTLVACADAGPPAISSNELPSLEAVTLSPGEKLSVMASTTIIGDVVAQVGGDALDLTVLMTAGQEPHSFEPAPVDVAGIEGADVVFVNGFGLEAELLAVMEPLSGRVPVVPLSAGVTPRQPDGPGSEDPHAWLDPHNVIIWTENISQMLAALDPANAGQYAANAAAYRAELEALDVYIREQVAQIPPESRKLVTNHDALGYFADRYGFEVVGSVFEGASDLAEPSAGQMAALVTAIEEQGVGAIFVETTVNPQLAEVVAAESGGEVRVLTLYTGSLGEPGSGAESYIAMLRLNIDTIVEALR